MGDSKKIALIGATGLVGTVMLQVLEASALRSCELLLAASERSVGKKLTFAGKSHTLQSVESVLNARPQVAIFSAGGDTSRAWAEKFAANGCFVVDNSSAWRMDPEVPLVVPEINADQLNKDRRIIANPNCSTIQMVLALSEIQKAYGIRRIVVSTYQSVTGTGVKAVDQLKKERAGQDVSDPAYPHPIDLNCLPHGGSFLENGSTTEEEKLSRETKKILSDDSIAVHATVVRIPTMGGHSEAINVELRKEFDLEEVRSLIGQTPGILIQDDPDTNLYPTPLNAEGKDEVFVGRIRRDDSRENCLSLWVVSDNLRKGAATNAVQIVEKLFQEGYCD